MGRTGGPACPRYVFKGPSHSSASGGRKEPLGRAGNIACLDLLIQALGDVSGPAERIDVLGIVYLTQFDIELAAVVIPSPPKEGEESRAYVFVKPDTP